MVFARKRLDSRGGSMNSSASSGSTPDSQGSPRQDERDLLHLLDDGEEGNSVCLQINIPDGRLLPEGDVMRDSRTVLRVEPLEDDSNIGFSIKISTTHYAFSLKRSSTIRPLSSFYTLSSILKSQHPYVSVASLPVRPLIYFQSARSRAEQIATWLSLILVDRQLLSNRTLHLFLQTQLGIERILENAEGIRDDQVVDYLSLKSKSYGGKDGFHDLFGSSYKRSRYMLSEHS